MKDNTFICSSCGAELPFSQCLEFDGQELCQSCLDSETAICSVCGDRIWNDNNEGDSDTPLCHSCYDRDFTNCIRCGALLRESNAYYSRDDEDDEEPMCYHCYSRISSDQSIKDYYYKPDPIFYGEGPRYFGVELEIDEGGEIASKAKQILEIANKAGAMMYCKHDGSLDDGFEIVTHPMTMDFHHENAPWKPILTKAVEMGYSSHRASTCGLHIHVSREAFGSGSGEQEACIARVLYFFEKFWEELLKFSRRTPRQLERWAARYGYKEQPRDILDHAKKGKHSGRYTCINLQNENTIEFRMFRGTLKYNTLIATLQLVDRVCDVALHLSDEDCKALSWTTFVAGCQAPELVQYLKERRLYVNDPVNSDEEV